MYSFHSIISPRAEERALAICNLLRLPDGRPTPDPKDLFSVFQEKVCYRGFIYKCGGDKLRQPQLKVELEQAFYRHRMILLGKDESEIVSLRRAPLAS